ncbi:MAG TPA: N-acetyltransferase [Acidobacteriota bacterium]|nr:N-acetyltransferase [Acidobacteriota bacterium]
MPTLKFTPISCVEPGNLAALLDEEERCWMTDLNWDYAPIRRILASFSEQRLLPGYVALNEQCAVGYTYFLTHHSKGIIGTVFTSRFEGAQEAADEILALAIECLKDTAAIRRIEAQIIPFNDLSLTAAFTRHGFQCHPRYYLELDLDSRQLPAKRPRPEKIVAWNPSFLPLAAEATLNSYRDQPDAQLCADYRTLEGCKSYLGSLMENPGCGSFLPEASFVVLDELGTCCGFLISSQIAQAAAMIPQVAIPPSHQGRGLGNALMHGCLSYFKARNYHTVSLTVTKQNRRAFEWYTRLGFRVRKEFGAFVWER